MESEFYNNVLFIGTYADEKYLKILQKDRLYYQLAANQTEKYYIDELSNYNFKLDVISGLVTIPFPKSSKIFMKKNNVKCKNYNIYNISFINLPIISIFSQLVKIKNEVKKWIKANRADNVLIIIYSMRIPYLYAAKIIKKIIPDSTILNIVPDLPIYMRTDKKNFINTVITRLNQNKTVKLQKYIDGYILYSEKMKEYLNCNENNWIVAEGVISSKNIKTSVKKINVKGNSSKKIIIYAGGIEERYGIQALVEGFIKSKLENVELHLYGSGSYSNILNQYTNKYKNIKYFGVLSPKEVKEKMYQADLLINPRPSSELFTQYSCPSKTIEYMSTGIPVMTTRLAGIPEKYFDYIYDISDETSDGIANSLKNFFAILEEERLQKAQLGKKYILKEKNAEVQVKRILNLSIKLKNTKGI